MSLQLNETTDLFGAQCAVLGFHEKFGCHIEALPNLPTRPQFELGIKLIVEEFNEVMEAAGAPVDVMVSAAKPSWQLEHKDIPHLAHEMADLVYVVLGMANRLGVDLGEVFDEIHLANMRKVGDGSIAQPKKIRKPEGWVAPDIEAVLRKQGWNAGHGQA